MPLFNALCLRDRILYCIYSHNEVTLEYIQSFLPNTTKDMIEPCLKGLILENTLTYEKNNYKIKIGYSNPFLRIFHILYTTKIPLTRTEIRNYIKHHQLNQIIDDLIRAQIIYEYRTELSKKNYLILFERKDEAIKLINQQMMTDLSDSVETSDQSHLIMLQQNQSILSYNSSNEDQDITTMTNNELKLIINLFDDIDIKRSRKIGRTEEYIITEIFNGKEKIAKKTIISLITKKLIKCSYKKFYYLNNGMIESIRTLYQKNKKLVIQPKLEEP